MNRECLGNAQRPSTFKDLLIAGLAREGTLCKCATNLTEHPAQLDRAVRKTLV
jgi:hypothetical protein